MTDILRMLLAALLILPTIYLLLVCGYLGVITVAAWFFRARRTLPAELPRIVLLIPAHNEGAQMDALLAHTAAIDYAADKWTLFVIADNCTDDTAERARSGGAQVFERHNPDLRGKGQALDWCLRTHADTLAQYDLIALVDADMIIHPQFLREMAASFGDERVQVVQSLNTVSNPDASWRSAFGYMGFTTVNFTRPAGRRQLGGTAELRGSGMAFRAPLLLRLGWPAHSLAEDVEFSKRLLLDGILVDFNPHAIVTSPIPLQVQQANVQQQRWEGGKIHIIKQYLPLMLRAAIARPSIAHIDAVLDLLVPPQSVLFVLLALSFIGAFVVHPSWAALIAACIAAVAFCIASGLWLQRAPLKVWLYLLALPLFLAWKLPLYARLLLRKAESHAWHRTPRDAEME